MKAAAPRAPTSTQHIAAKGSAKGRAASAASTGAASFAGALANAVAAKAAGAAPGAVRAAASSAASAKAGAAPLRSTARDAARSAASLVRGRPTDEAAARTAAEAGAGRAVAALAAGGLPADAKAAAAPTARRGEPQVQVTDLRRRSAAAAETARSTETKPQPASARTAETGAGDGTAAAKPFVARLAAAGTDAKAAAAPRATPLERIRAMSGSDLARAVSLVVRDGGGEIRLSLKPESLGGVRIRLSLEDGKVEGRIVVDTPEARQAFEAALDSLTRALQADGFQTGSLQVSVSGGNANGSRQAAGLLGDAITEAHRRASHEALSAAVPPAEWDGGGDGLVNVFA